MSELIDLYDSIELDIEDENFTKSQVFIGRVQEGGKKKSRMDEEALISREVYHFLKKMNWYRNLIIHEKSKINIDVMITFFNWINSSNEFVEFLGINQKLTMSIEEMKNQLPKIFVDEIFKILNTKNTSTKNPSKDINKHIEFVTPEVRSQLFLLLNNTKNYGDLFQRNRALFKFVSLKIQLDVVFLRLDAAFLFLEEKKDFKVTTFKQFVLSLKEDLNDGKISSISIFIIDIIYTAFNPKLLLKTNVSMTIKDMEEIIKYLEIIQQVRNDVYHFNDLRDEYYKIIKDMMLFFTKDEVIVKNFEEKSDFSKFRY